MMTMIIRYSTGAVTFDGRQMSAYNLVNQQCSDICTSLLWLLRHAIDVINLLHI